MTDREFSFDLNVDGVQDTDTVAVNILPANDSLPADTENVSLVGGRATVEFTDERGSQFPIPFRIQVAVTRAADSRTESESVALGRSTLLAPAPSIFPADGKKLTSGLQQFRFTPAIDGWLYRTDIDGSDGEFSSNSEITAAVPTNGLPFDVDFLIDRRDGSDITVITRTYIAASESMFSIVPQPGSTLSSTSVDFNVSGIPDSHHWDLKIFRDSDDADAFIDGSGNNGLLFNTGVLDPSSGPRTVAPANLPRDGSEFSVVVSWFVMGGSNFSDVHRERIDYTATTSTQPANSSVHNEFGRLVSFAPAIIRSPNEPWNFTSSQNGQTLNDFELVYTGNTIQNPIRFFGSDSNPVRDITFNRGLVSVPQTSPWRNNDIATCPIFGYKTSNIQFNEVVVVGGRAGIMMQQGHRTRLTHCISVEPWRHGFQIDDDEPLDGDMGFIKQSLVYALTKARAESTGLTMSTGADMINITKPNYNGGNSYLVEDVVVVGSHGPNGTLFIQDKGQPSANAGGTIFRRCRALLGNNLPLTDAGNRGIRSEDFIAYSPANGPASDWVDERNAHSFNWFDFGRTSGPQYDAIARSPNRSGGRHTNYRAHIVNSGGLRRDNYYPSPGGSDVHGDNQDVFYAHSLADKPELINSNFSDTSLTLQEAWAAAKSSLADLPVFEHELFDRNDWSDWVNAQ